MLHLPAGSVIVLVAPSGTGKSTWARRHLGEHLVVSSDQLRGVVGANEHDQRASRDAFDLLDLIVAARGRRGLTTVVDSTGLQADRRAAYRDLAKSAGVPAIAVVLDLPEKEAKARNRSRARPVPAKAIASQWAQFAEAKLTLHEEGFAAVHVVTDLDAPARIVGADVAAAIGEGRQTDGQGPQVHLHLGRFDLRGGDPQHDLAAIARTAEEVGFAGIWLMDHLVQVPQVGRAWDDLPECWSTLAWLAAHTEHVRLGSLVSPVTFRPMAVLAKAAATVDVLSGGRVTCGIGLGWFEAEHRDLGVPMPPLDTRYGLLEDHLRGLPLLWGSGAKAYEGHEVNLREATSYPRPAQGRIPLLVGGNGPRRTLALAAKWADAVNLQGDPTAIKKGIAELHGHLDGVGRDRAEVTVTARVAGLTRPTGSALAAALAQLAPAPAPAEAWGASIGAAVVDDQVARLRGLHQLGVDQVMLSAAEATVDGVAQFAPVLEALRQD